VSGCRRRRRHRHLNVSERARCFVCSCALRCSERLRALAVIQLRYYIIILCFLSVHWAPDQLSNASVVQQHKHTHVVLVDVAALKPTQRPLCGHLSTALFAPFCPPSTLKCDKIHKSNLRSVMGQGAVTRRWNTSWYLFHLQFVLVSNRYRAVSEWISSRYPSRLLFAGCLECARALWLQRTVIRSSGGGRRRQAMRNANV